MTNLKKVFSTAVSFVTIMWSVGAGALAFPVSAQAATLNAGDLIKASGPAVYFYAADGKRYVFPDEKTYFSWFVDFSSVKSITDAELAAITIGGNVTIRPGTKLVKITTDPKTYAVTKCGTLHWIESESVAKALYGDAWATRVVDVPDSFFVNYTIGSSIPNNVHPDGQLVTYSGDSNKYVVMGGQKRKIADDAAFNANKWNMVDSVVTTITYADGAAVTGLEADNFWTVSCGTGVATVSGNVTVALASDTPAGATVPKNAMSVPMIKVNLTAGNEDAIVTGLRFHRVGVGSTSDFANVYLYDQTGARMTTGRSVNATSNLVEFNSLNISIPANGMKSYYVYADYNSPGTTGGNHAFELADAASVVLSGTGTVSGSFPVRGNVFVVGTASAGTLQIQPGPQPANPTIGAKDVEVSTFKLTANTNDIRVNRVTLYQAGDINNGDLTNLTVWQGTTKVGSAGTIDSAGHVVLNFDTPYLIPNGVTRVFSVHGDVAGRAGRTIVTYVEYATDVMGTDTVYNSGASVNFANFDGSDAAKKVTVTTQGGNLTFAFNGPASTNVAKGKLGVQLYKFSLTSADNDLEIRYLRTKLDAVSGVLISAGGSATKYLKNIKIVNTDTGTTVMGPKELSGAAGEITETLNFNDTFTIKAGTTMNLAIVADLSNTEEVGGDFIDKTYTASWLAFTLGDVKVVNTGESLALDKIVPNSNTTGNQMTVKASSLTAALASTPVSGTIVKKSATKPVVGISLASGAQSDVTVTNMTLQCQASIWGSAYAANKCYKRVTSLGVYDGDTLVGTAKAPDSVTGQASITNMNLKIAKGTTKSLTVKATFSSDATDSATTTDKISVGVPASGITAQDEDANTLDMSGAAIADALKVTQLGLTPSVVQSILPHGTITIAADAHPSTSIVVAGKDVWVPFARYKATAQYEDMLIDRLTVSSTVGGDNADFVQVAIASGGAVKGANTLSAGPFGVVDVDLTGNNITVPKDGSVNFEVWAKLATVQASSTVHGATTGVCRTGHSPALGLLSNLQTGEWNANYAGKLNVRTTGNASGERVYAATGATTGNAQVLRKTKPVVTKQNLTNTVLSSGELELYRVQVGADSAGSIALKQMAFQVSKSANVTAGSFRLYRGSTPVPSSEYTVVNATSGADLYTGTVSAGVGSFIAAVAFTGEDSINGSGNIYSLRATVSYTGTGNNITTSFYRDGTMPVVTGYLANGAVGVFANSTSIFNIDTSVGGGAAPTNLGTFVWSDNSEVPHYSSITPGSRDWTNDVYVEDLAQSATLSN